MREARSPALSLCRAYSIVIGSTRLQFKQGRIPAIIRTNRSSQKDSRSSLSRKRIVSSRSRISRNPYGLPVTEQYCSQGFTPKCSSMRSEEHTSELQSLMRISYAVFCLKTKIQIINIKLMLTQMPQSLSQKSVFNMLHIYVYIVPLLHTLQ